MNRDKNGHAMLLHEKGIDVVAPYCAFNYWDYEDHRRDFVKPVKIYDDYKLVYLLNKSTDKFRKKFPRLYKIQNPQRKKGTILVVVSRSTFPLRACRRPRKCLRGERGRRRGPG